MRTVWKYEVKMGRFWHLIPQGARVLSVHRRPGEAQMWILVNPDAPTETRHFVVVYTGSPIPSEATRFIGTFFIGEDLVFHLFEADGPGING